MSSSVDEQDTQDMLRLARGQDTALNELMARHSQQVFRYLLRSLQNEDDAADLAQETFVKIYQNRAKFDPAQKFNTWLYAIAGNLVRDRYRWRTRHPHISMDAEPHETAEGRSMKENLLDSTPAPSESLEKEERSQAVKSAIGALPPELREPLILSVYEGLSQIEIGQILGCSTKAVETRIYRARNQLREKLSRVFAESER
jgi:RNA polymerase sigma-70 factor (ECF subfamily)